jgi:BirA family biotin operon repressor/biotin-[acetyl-CoA-carboxylase] ligase
LSFFDRERFAALLATRFLGRPFHYFESCDSTNTRVMQLAAQGAPEGCLALTDSQSAGRGRWGRTWESPAAKNLLFSFLLRPQKGRLSQLTPLFGLACLKAMGMGKLKWPNDLWIAGKKISGILVEGSPEALVVGIGINVNQEPEEFPQELRAQASSLKIECGRGWDREALLAEILSSCEGLYTQWKSRGFAEIMAEWNKNALFIGENVKGGESQGLGLGLDEEGAFLIRTDQGVEKLVSGEVFQVRPVLD